MQFSNQKYSSSENIENDLIQTSYNSQANYHSSKRKPNLKTPINIPNGLETPLNKNVVNRSFYSNPNYQNSLANFRSETSSPADHFINNRLNLASKYSSNNEDFEKKRITHASPLSDSISRYSGTPNSTALYNLPFHRAQGLRQPNSNKIPYSSDMNNKAILKKENRYKVPYVIEEENESKTRKVSPTRLNLLTLNAEVEELLEKSTKITTRLSDTKKNSVIDDNDEYSTYNREPRQSESRFLTVNDSARKREHNNSLHIDRNFESNYQTGNSAINRTFDYNLTYKNRPGYDSTPHSVHSTHTEEKRRTNILNDNKNAILKNRGRTPDPMTKPYYTSKNLSISNEPPNPYLIFEFIQGNKDIFSTKHLNFDQPKDYNPKYHNTSKDILLDSSINQLESSPKKTNDSYQHHKMNSDLKVSTEPLNFVDISSINMENQN